MKRDPAFDAALERRGLGVVQGFLQFQAAASGEGAPVRGLAGPKGEGITRAYVEDWVRRKRSDNERRERRRWMRVAAIAAATAVAVIALGAAVIALSSWLLPIPLGR